MNRGKDMIRKKRLVGRMRRQRKSTSISIGSYRAQTKKKIERIFMTVRWRLRRIITSEINIFKKTLSIIEHLKRADKTVSEFLADAQERTKINMLIKELQINMLLKKLHLWEWERINFQWFDEIYKIFVERKRRKMRADADVLEEKCMKYIQSRMDEGLPHATAPLGMYIKKEVLQTYYEFLRYDNAYQQKAFLEFLKKKTENGYNCLAISAYLEKKYKHSSYDEYVALTDYTGGALELGLPELWLEFFQGGAEYADIIPDERPQVQYWFTNTANIPRFIFERPYVKEFTEQEFYDRFIEEWDSTHAKPAYDDRYDPVDDYEYYDELADRPERAYQQYVNAVLRFERSHTVLHQAGESGHHS